MSKNIGFSLAELVEMRQLASQRSAEVQASMNELASQIEFVDRMIQSHLAGGSFDTHLALVAAGRRLAALLERVAEYDLPPVMQAKVVAGENRRRDGFVEKYGEIVWELEPLDPTDLQGIVRKAIVSVLDMEAVPLPSGLCANNLRILRSYGREGGEMPVMLPHGTNRPTSIRFVEGDE